MTREEGTNNSPDLGVGPSEWTRFLFLPVIVTILLAGGVYWLHSQPAGTLARDQPSSIQVQLIRALEPAPVAIEALPPPVIPNVGTQQEAPIREADRFTAEKTIPLEAAAERVQAEPAPRKATTTAMASINSASEAVAENYQRSLLRHIERFRRYPPEARRDRLEGTVQVVFALGRDGRVSNVRVMNSSGKSVLDQEAIETIRRAQPLPVIPSDLPDRLNILLPIEFDRS